MKEIGQFFNKFNSIAVREIKRREYICGIIKKSTNQEIGIEDIIFVNRVIKIKGTSGLKNQILIKKDYILKQILKNLPNIIDIQ
jgi:hypothetical protein